MAHYTPRNRSRNSKKTTVTPKSVVSIARDLITANIDVKNQDTYAYNIQDRVFTIYTINNQELRIRGINRIGVFPQFSTSNRSMIDSYLIELEFLLKDLTLELGEDNSIFHVEKNVAFLNREQTHFAESTTEKNNLIIYGHNNPICINLKCVYHFIDLNETEAKLALSEDAFIIKTRSNFGAPKTTVGKPHEAPSTSQAISSFYSKPTEEKAEKTVEQIEKSKSQITINENESYGPINLQYADDGYARTNCHNFIVAENSKTQFLKHLNLYKERAIDYDWQGPVANPYRNVLVTPVSLPSNRTFLRTLREHRENGDIERVMFDSGGFQVMTGSLPKINSLEDLLEQDTQIYSEEDWADIYILPDHPPVGEDSFTDLDRKIVSTVESSLKFVDGLPDKIKYKCAPVFHAKYLEHIEYFYEGYEDIIKLSKFATYSAAGKTFKDKPRQLDVETMRILQALVPKLEEVDASLHCLGIASPPAVFCLSYLGVRTFDSSTAIKVASTGKILFPYLTAKNCSDRREDSITAEQLVGFRELTGHRCPFCEDLEELKEETMIRKLHNLVVLDQLSYIYRDLDLNLLTKHANFYAKRLNELGTAEQFSLL